MLIFLVKQRSFEHIRYKPHIWFPNILNAFKTELLFPSSFMYTFHTANQGNTDSTLSRGRLQGRWRQTPPFFYYSLCSVLTKSQHYLRTVRIGTLVFPLIQKMLFFYHFYTKKWFDINHNSLIAFSIRNNNKAIPLFCLLYQNLGRVE